MITKNSLFFKWKKKLMLSEITNFCLKYTEYQAVMIKDFSCSWIIYFHNFLFAVHLNKRGPPCFCNKAQLHEKKSNFISAIIFCSWLVYFHVHKYIYFNKRRPLHSFRTKLNYTKSIKREVFYLKNKRKIWELRRICEGI